MKQLLTILMAAVIIVLGFLYKDTFLHLLREGQLIAIPISIFLVSILVFFPFLPYSVLAGMIGSIFGIWLGMGISILGICIGTMGMFLMSRYGFQGWTQRYIKKYPRMQEYEGYFNKNAFLSILAARLVPVIPSPVVNIICGVSMVSWLVFISASVLGKLPAIFLFTFAGTLFNQSKLFTVGVYSGYFVIVWLIAILKIKKSKIKTI